MSSLSSTTSSSPSYKISIVIVRHHDIIIRKEDQQRAATNDIMKPDIGTNTFPWSVVMCQQRTETGDSVLKVDKTVSGSLSAGEETATSTVASFTSLCQKENWAGSLWLSGMDQRGRRASLTYWRMANMWRTHTDQQSSTTHRRGWNTQRWKELNSHFSCE